MIASATASVLALVTAAGPAPAPAPDPSRPRPVEPSSRSVDHVPVIPEPVEPEPRPAPDSEPEFEPAARAEPVVARVPPPAGEAGQSRPLPPGPGRSMVAVGVGLTLASIAGYGVMAAGFVVRENAEGQLAGLDEQDERLRDKRRLHRLGGRMALGAGIASAASMIAGITLVVVGRRRAIEQDRATAWIPTIVPGPGGVVCRGRF